jgi:CheY-like chemotaxis protein
METELSAPTHFVSVSVIDTGQGMDSITRQHLFEPFFTTKDVGKGTGLGLATAYGIIDNHGGWIEVASQLNEGATFQAFLPAVEISNQPVVESGKIEGDQLKGGNETILVVDDEVPICELARNTLSAFGYDVWTALDGEEGFQYYQKRSREIDLVILDLSMPKMSGQELLGRIRQINPQVKVIISSGYLNGESGLREDECISAFIQKPFSLSDLVRVVRKVLDS